MCCTCEERIKMASTSEELSGSQRTVSPLRIAIPQILAVSVKNVLLLGFGTTIGFPTILIGSLSGQNSEEPISISQEAISWIGSLTYLCNPIGCVLSGIITQPLGRRRSMQLVNLPYLAAWLLFHFATESWHVFVALGIIGFSGGLLEAPVLTYVAEITEPSLRGALSSTSIMSINLGVLIAFILGTFLNWRTMALVNACIPLVAFVLLMFVPESPYWLISRNRLEEAQNSLAWLRGWTSKSEIEEEYLQIYDNLQEHPMTTHSTRRLFSLKKIKSYLKPSFMKPFFLITLTFIMGHFGNTPLTVYAIQIFNLLEVPVGSYYATIYIGIVQLLAVIICVFTIKFLGKRILVTISLIGVLICFLATGIYSHTVGANYFHDNNLNILKEYFNWIPLVTLIGQAFFTYLCIKGLPWILVGELYNNDVRAFGSGFSAATGYVFGFIANKTFLSSVEFATFPGVLWFYTTITFIGLVLLYFLLPETEGKSLAQITEHYSGGKKLDNRIYRGLKKSNEQQKPTFD